MRPAERAAGSAAPERLRDAFEGSPEARGDGQTLPPVATTRGTGGGLPLGAWTFARPSAAPSAAGEPSRVGDAAAVAPLTGEALVRSLSDAVIRCIQQHPTREDARIADKLASFVFTDTAQEFVAAVRRGEHPQLDELGADALARAYGDETERPQHVYMLTLNGRSSWGGAVVFEKDIFPEGFYRTRALETVAPVGLDKQPFTGDRAPMLFEQPYFRWLGDRHEFKLGDADDNANLRLVEHLAARGGGQVTLWRGTGEAYDTPAELLTPGPDGRYPVGSMSHFGDDLASVMTTPDRKAAEGWANPTLVSFSFSADELKTLAREGLLYAGIEYEYLEVALLYDRDPARGRGQEALRRMTQVTRESSPID